MTFDELPDGARFTVDEFVFGNKNVPMMKIPIKEGTTANAIRLGAGEGRYIWPLLPEKTTSYYYYIEAGTLINTPAETNAKENGE